jgi:hypothetical protein
VGVYDPAMAKLRLGSGWYGLEVGSRWRDASGTIKVVILGIQRSGVIVYRREDAALDEERVTNVVRFVETFAPADRALSANEQASAPTGN